MEEQTTLDCALLLRHNNKMKQALKIASISAFSILLGGVAAYVLVQSRAPTPHVQSRTKAVVSQAGQFSPKVVLLGDSIVELAYVPELCNRSVLNAGLAGANVAQVKELASKILPDLKPEIIAVAVGVNDSTKSHRTPQEDFESDYRKLLVLARATGARVVPVTIEPVSCDNDVFDVDEIKRKNATIRRFALPVLDMWSAMRDKDQDCLPAAFSDDKTHPNATGYVTWKAALSRSLCAPQTNKHT